ncbi:MAG TPA: class I SAM-dependent methyltransferase [Polyangiaceae bacterium]
MRTDPNDADEAFDALYPPHIRRVSRRFWTPVAVARRAALLLRDAGARSVLDVGSGVGKFAIVAAQTAPELRVVGIEQRAHLVDFALRARRTLEVPNVDFVVGNATEASWRAYDGLYFFNSFAENTFEPEARLDDLAELSLNRFAEDVLRTHAALRAAPRGTAVATYCGSSGRVPCNFELVSIEPAASSWLRLWIKTESSDDGSFFVEVNDTVERHPASQGRRA